MTLATAALLAATTFFDYFEARNTAARFTYAPPPDGESVRIEKPACDFRGSCPVCEGKKELVLEEPNFGQANGRLGGAKKQHVTCPVCRGAGRYVMFAVPAELVTTVAKEHERFASEHQGRGEIAVGGAFVPAKDHAGLSKAQLKIVADAFGEPCAKCLWSGIEPCAKCHGAAVLPCPEKDCKGGFLVTTTTLTKTRTSSGGGINFGNRSGLNTNRSRRTTSKETKVNVQVCPRCSGAAKVPCPECHGRRAHPCAKCNGTGIKRKAGLR